MLDRRPRRSGSNFRDRFGGGSVNIAAIRLKKALERLDMTTDQNQSNPVARPPAASRLIRTSTWLGTWAVACIAIFILRFPKIWLLVGESWAGLLIGFVVLWLGGALLYLAFSQLDRIKSEGLKFVAQMLLCLLVTIIIGGVILIITF